MKKILALDGGGLRGFFSLGILERIETILRQRGGAETSEMVLSDYFDFIGGTSTGAIIAALLSKGLSVAEIREHYEELGPVVFRRKPWWRSWRSFYAAEPIARILKELFREDSGELMKLGSGSLKTKLLIVMRNGSTGSTWPVTNEPKAMFNHSESTGTPSNLNIPLWQLIRASTAAPVFFPTELVSLRAPDGTPLEFEFVDGGLTPYNNPALAMFLAATVPEYEINYPTGSEQLFICSVGTGALTEEYGPGQLGAINAIGGALRGLRGLIDSVGSEQDKLCRVLGTCLHGDEIDLEVGDLKACGLGLFTYCRYQHHFTPDEMTRCRAESGSKKPFVLDDLASIPTLKQLGREYAQGTVVEGHLPQ